LDVRRAEERTDSRLREFQRENQGLRDEVANLQGQLHQQELRHNQELAIALCGINRNTRKIGEMAQQMVNPLNHPQHPVNSNDSVGSRLPSTFHSAASNEHPLVPPAPAMVPVWPNPGEGIHHPDANPTTYPTNLQEDPTTFPKLLDRFLMNCKFLLILFTYVAIFTWKISSSFWTGFTSIISIQQTDQFSRRRTEIPLLCFM
jgi:hypothetical protein